MIKLVLKTSAPSSFLYHTGQGEMVEKLYEDSKNENNCMTLTVIGLLETEE